MQPLFWFLDRYFPENLLFGQAKISLKNFQGVITKYFPYKAASRTLLMCELPVLAKKAIKCSWYKDLKKISRYFWTGRNYIIAVLDRHFKNPGLDPAPMPCIL